MGSSRDPFPAESRPQELAVQLQEARELAPLQVGRRQGGVQRGLQVSRSLVPAPPGVGLCWLHLRVGRRQAYSHFQLVEGIHFALAG